MVKINSKVKEETLKALKIEAEKDGRTESGMIRKILEDYFKPRFRQNNIDASKIIEAGAKVKHMTAFFNERNKLKDMLGNGSEATDINQMGEFYKNMQEETIKANSDLNK